MDLDIFLILFAEVPLDGIKIYANASKNKNFELSGIDKEIKGFLNLADGIDELEDKE